MLRISPITTLPANYEAFLEEIAAGLERIYGPAAAAEYRRRGRRNFAASLLHPGVSAFAAELRGETAGLIVLLKRGDTGEISLLHVLKSCQGLGVEQALVKQAVNHLREPLRVLHILFECLPLCKLNLADTFQALGFQHIARELMLAPLRAPGLQVGHNRLSIACPRDAWKPLAECIVDAYTGHSEQRLHREVTNLAGAKEFIERVATGSYGGVHPEMIRIIRDEEGCAAGLLGCQVAPETGFILQLVTRRNARGRGYGLALLQEYAEVLRSQGLASVALGVTSENPARRLYLKAGFRTVMPVAAYVWWRK